MDNSASRGGGIFNFGDLTIDTSTISGNTAVRSDGDGGGIQSNGRVVTIIDSVFTDNSAQRHGGAVSSDQLLEITGSTFSNNTAGSSGGAIRSRDTTVIVGSTISGNSSGGSGGGIAADPFLTISNSTIYGNLADANLSGSGIGGGIDVNQAAVTLDNTIVANNHRRTVIRDDIAGSVLATFSIVSAGTGAAITDNGGSLIGTADAPIDARLASLADNGGPTQTHALLFGSPALDAGDPDFAPPPDLDQRGAGFARVVDDGGGLQIDMGAYEAQSAPLEADLNADGMIDGVDAGIMFANWTANEPGLAGLGYADGNLNGDPFIDARDAGVLFGMWTVLPLNASSSASLGSTVETLTTVSFDASPAAVLAQTSYSSSSSETRESQLRSQAFADEYLMSSYQNDPLLNTSELLRMSRSTDAQDEIAVDLALESYGLEDELFG